MRDVFGFDLGDRRTLRTRFPTRWSHDERRFGSKGTNTVETQSSPPQAFLNAYTNVSNQAAQVAATPYQSYPGQVVAQFSPDQISGIGQVENLTANGGVQAPYLQAAQQDVSNATTPLWNNVQQFSPSAVAQYQSPYTQNVLNTTEAAEANTDAQQLQQVKGNAISQGAFGGDREAVAEGVTTGQQAVANNATNAQIENTGYQNALGEFNSQQQAQLGANEANAWLNSQAGAAEANLGSEALSTGLEGASSALQAGSLEQQLAQENLNVPYEQYLAAQAYPFQTTQFEAGIDEGLGGASGGTSSTTSPAASTASQIAGIGLGATGIIGATGGFGSAGWLTGLLAARGGAIEREAGGMVPRYAAGGMSPATSTSPLTPFSNSGPLIPSNLTNVPDVSVSIVPNATATRGGSGPPQAPQPVNPATLASTLQNESGALRGIGWNNNGRGAGPNNSNGLGTGVSNPASNVLTGDTPDGMATGNNLSNLSADAAANEQMGAEGMSSGGMIPRRDVGGAASAATGQPLIEVSMEPQTPAPDPSSDPSSSSQSAPWWAPIMQENLDTQMMNSLGGSSSGMASGGMVSRQHFATGGMSLSQEDPYWTRQEESESVNRHGLLASPIAGRTDQIAISPAAGSYVIPADVISGLGEGNTLAGANVMQHILETGPHGLKLPPQPHGKGPPRPPPAYREGEGDNGMASGGMVPGYAAGGMSPAVSSYLSANGAPAGSVPGGSSLTSSTGIPELDHYLNNTAAGAYHPPVAVPATPTASASPSSSSPPALAASDVSQTPWALEEAASASEGGMQARGGGVPRRADGGPSGDGNGGMGLPSYVNLDDFNVPMDTSDVDEAPAPASKQNITVSPSPDRQHDDAAPSSGGGMQGPTAASAPKPAPKQQGPMVPRHNMQPTPGTAGAPRFSTSMGSGSGSGMQPRDNDTWDKPSAYDDAPTPVQKPVVSNTSPTAKPNTGFNAKADPWLALAEAGFGMAAGKSPHALENIGAGAERGVQSYIQQTQDANKQNLTVQDTQARIEQQKQDTLARINEQHLYHDQLDTSRQDRNAETARWHDMENANTQERMAMTMAMREMARSGNSAEKGFVPYGFDKDGNALVMNKSTGEVKNTGIQAGMSPAQQASAEARGQGLDLRTQAFNELVKQHGIQNDRNAQNDLQNHLNKMTDQEIHLYLGGKDPISGKFNTSIPEAKRQAEQFRDPSGGDGAPPPASLSGSPPPVSSFFQ